MGNLTKEQYAERLAAKKRLMYNVARKQCFCETLRDIYDLLHEYPDKELRDKIREHLIDLMIAGKHISDRFNYYVNTYHDETGSQGDNLKSVPHFREKAKMRLERRKHKDD